MPTYAAFLRAINLGAKRKFPKDAIRAATESIGATEVETYINTGNVRLTVPMRSRPKIEAALEAAYLADREFEVPTMVLTRAELSGVAADADELWAESGEPAAHYITLFKSAPSVEAVAALAALERAGERIVVRGRAAHHVITAGSFHEAKLANSREFRALGVGTARNVTVIRELATRWS